MSDTAALQAAFAQALAVRDVGTADVAMLRGAPRDVRRRLGFYRGNVQASAHKALRNAYPVCERLVGEHFFEGMAYAYAAVTPSTSGDLNEYGATLPTFMRTFAPAAALAYLPDVATLEWRVHRAHYAADRPPLDLRGLAALSPDASATFAPRSIRPARSWRPPRRRRASGRPISPAATGGSRSTPTQDLSARWSTGRTTAWRSRHSTRPRLPSSRHVQRASRSPRRRRRPRRTTVHSTCRRICRVGCAIA